MFSCGSTKKEPVASGGPCIYDTTIQAATLVSVLNDTNNTAIRFGYLLSGGDTIYDQIEKSKLENIYHLNASAIDTGDQFQFWNLSLTTGSCAGQQYFTFNRFNE